MNILEYQLNPLFSRARNAFLVTGKGELEPDKFNRALLKRNQTGNWKLREGRVVVGDAIFLILPSLNKKNGGYPRELFAGIVTKISRTGEDKGACFHTDKLHKLDNVEDNIMQFLGDKTPPQGNLVQTVWSGLTQHSDVSIEDMEDETAYAEGELRYRLHLSRERNPLVVSQAKERRLKESNGRLECEVCSFDFIAVYGLLGKGFIEAHHKIPVASMDAERKIKPSELALVCSNCHRMLHRTRPLATPAELKEKLIYNTV